jgi:hypothetical protein
MLEVLRVFRRLGQAAWIEAYQRGARRRIAP